MNRRGFTMVELMATISMLILLASISLPRYQQIRKRAQAADIVASMSALRTAAFSYNSTTGNWPRRAGFGRVPNGLAPYLPGSFQMQTPDRRLAWRTTNATVGGQPLQLQAIWMRTTDPIFCQGVSGLLGGAGNSALITNCRRRGGDVIWLIDN